MKWFRRVLGSAVILFGLVWSIFSIMAIADPVGTQLADDSDPFGPPPSLTVSLVHLALIRE